MNQISVGKIVGRVDGPFWAQVHDFSPVEPDKFTARGRLLAVVTLAKADEENEITTVERGREALSHIHELYFGDLEMPAFDCLQKTVEQLQDDPDLTVDCMAVLGDLVYIVSTMGGIWVREGGREGWLIHPQTKPVLTKLSGKILPNRQFVLGNAQFWQHIPLGVVKAALESNIDQAVDTLGAVAHGNQKAQGVAGVIIGSSSLVFPKNVEQNPVVTPPTLNVGPSTNFLQKMLEKLPRRSGPIFIQYESSKSKKTLIMGIIFLVVFLALVLVGRARYQYITSGKARLDARSEELEFKFNEAKALVILNPARSQQLLTEIKTDLADIHTKGGSKYTNKNLQAVESELEATINKSQGINEINLTEVLDLGLVRDGLTGQKLALQEEKLIVLDTESDRLVTVDPVKKSGAVIAGKEALGNTKLLATYPGKTMVFSEKGILECSMINNQCSIKIKTDSEWGEVVGMRMFASNIYLLTKTNIWRYQSTETGFGTKQSWVAKTENVDLAGSTSLTIDGSVWVNRGNETLKLTRGVKDSFTMSGLPKPLGAETIFYVSEEAEKVYILDKTNQRIVVLKKTGEYLAQYLNNDLEKVTDLVANEKQNKVYVVAGSKIWQIDI